MPKRVSIASLKRLAQDQGLIQTVLIAHDGERMHVVTYGDTVENCKLAAAAGNHYKRALGFPPSACNDVPSRARSRRNK